MSTIGQRGCRVVMYNRDRTGHLYLRYNFNGRRRSPSLGLYRFNADGQVDPKVTAAANAEQRRVHSCLLAGADPDASQPASGHLTETWTFDQAFKKFLGPDGPVLDVTKQQRKRYEQTQREVLVKFGAHRVVSDFLPGHLEAYANCRRKAISDKGKSSGVRQAEIEVRCILRVLRWLKFSHGVAAINVTEHRELLKNLKDAQSPNRPRFTDANVASLAKKLDQIDPRIALLLAIQDGQRAGQILRCRRSDLSFEPDPDSATVMAVLKVSGGPHKDPVEHVITPAATTRLRSALDSGHLRELEICFGTDGVDYPLFPGGIAGLPPDGIVPAGQYAPLSREYAADVLGELEKLAGVAHDDGRGFHGLRRRMVDVVMEGGASLDEIKAAGGWQSIQIPADLYRDREDHKQRVRAAKRMRGHTIVDVSPTE